MVNLVDKLGDLFDLGLVELGLVDSATHIKMENGGETPGGVVSAMSSQRQRHNCLGLGLRTLGLRSPARLHPQV